MSTRGPIFASANSVLGAHAPRNYQDAFGHAGSSGHVTASSEGHMLLFDMHRYIAAAGPGRIIVNAQKKQVFFSQGTAADCVFYLLRGNVRIAVMSGAGKKATVRLVGPGEFFGEQAMAAKPELRTTTAMATTDSVALRIDRTEFLRLARQEPSFSFLFASSLISSNMRYQADLADQMCNTADKRLARLLLRLAESNSAEEDCALIPDLSQATLANMIGSTRPRVNGFLNRFRKLGLMECDPRMRVYKSRLSAFLRA